MKVKDVFNSKIYPFSAGLRRIVQISKLRNRLTHGKGIFFSPLCFASQNIRPLRGQIYCFLALIIFLSISSPASSQEGKDSSGYTVAVLQFAPQDDSMKNAAQAIGSLVQVYLTAAPDIIPVERADIDKALEEVELNLSGNVNPDQAGKIGQITGAQILVAGRVFAVENQMFAVAKVISTETSRVFGSVVSDTLRGDQKKMAADLSAKVIEILNERRDVLLPKPVVADNWLRDMRDLLSGRELPSVSIRIGERSLSSDLPNPTASTVLQQLLLNLGATVIDPLSSTGRAEIELTGEAVSEFGMRKGNLVSSKARIELRAIETKSGKILAAASEPAVGVDLGAEYAGKKAIDTAAIAAAKKILPVLINCCSVKKSAQSEAAEPKKDLEKKAGTEKGK